MTGISQQFCVRWNSHLGSLGAAFPQLLAGQQFVDVTLACDGHQVHCHRLVLAACSSYFESLLSENPCKHPIIILPKDIKLWEIHALVDFMYKGQVNVSQAGLPQLLKCAETLQIRGLCGTESSLNEVANGKMERCIDPNVLPTTNSSPNFNFTSMFASNLLNANYSNVTDDEQQPFRQQHSDQQRSTFSNSSSNNGDNVKSTNHRSNETFGKNKPSKTVHNDKIAIEHCKTNSLKRLNENADTVSNTGSNELNIKCEEIDSDANAADDGIDDDLDERSNSKQSEYTMQQNDAIVCVDNDIICDGSKETSIQHNESNAENEMHDFFTNDATDSITIIKTDPIDEVNVCYSPSWSLHGNGNGNGNGNRNGNGNTNSNGNDNDNGTGEHSARIDESYFECDLTQLPTSLKYNRNTMSIFVKRTTGTKVTDNLFSKRLKINDKMDGFSENIVCSPHFNPIEHVDNNKSNGSQSSSNGQLRHTDNDNYVKKYHSNDDDDNDDDDDDDDHHHHDEDELLKPIEKRKDRLMELLQSCSDPIRNAVVLRSPRGNQPRSYTTDALYSALMDVKSGESIYRASQIHGVPRKTLRNWMKRWHIKSVYPMPYQLKKAAEKKRQTVQQTTTTATAHDELL